ncbi:MAG: VOC family protein [Armatimonadetes bacterium]|nr:VOC family protein [Armatimonadota bacterium]
MQRVFANLILDVQSVERSVGFYRDALGFDVRDTDEWDGHHLAYVGTDGFELLLLEQPIEDQNPAIQRGGGLVMNFRVSGLSEMADALKRVPVQVLRDLEEPQYGDRTLLIADPDGYAILLSEPVGTVH